MKIFNQNQSFLLRSHLLTKSYIKSQVAAALNEDLGVLGDITSQALIEQTQVSTANIVLKQDAVLCGIDFAISAFKQLDKKRIGAGFSFKDQYGAYFSAL